MWINVEKVSLTVIDGFLLRDLLDRKIWNFPQNFLCFSTSPKDLPLCQPESLCL